MKTDKYEIPWISCRTAKGFLRQLDELNERWKRGSWIFRGQNDMSKELLPSAMRQDTLITRFIDKHIDSYNSRRFVTDENAKRYCKYFDENGYKEHVKHVLHIVAEIKAVGAFIELADQSGLVVPVDSDAAIAFTRWPIDRLVKHYLNKPCINEIRHDPKSIIYALAQHHGIPTRLLDWTFRPMVAAYFAAYDSEQRCGNPNDTQPKHIVVWATRWKDLPNSNLVRVTHLRSQIGNLQAQEGVFIYNLFADTDRREDGCWRCIDRRLEIIVQNEAVFKFSLPFSERSKVLELLERKGYRRPYLMPTYDNVAREFTSGRLDPIEFMERF